MRSKFYGDKFLPFHQQSDLSCTENRWENHLLVPDGLVATLNGAKDMGTVCFKELGGVAGLLFCGSLLFIVVACLLASLLVAGGLLVACLLVVAAMYDSLSWIDHVPLILPASQQSPAWWTEMGKPENPLPSDGVGSLESTGSKYLYFPIPQRNTIDKQNPIPDARMVAPLQPMAY